MANTLHIRAVGDLLSPYLDDTGRPVPGRYAGRHRKTREPLPEGEMVADHPDYRRAVAREELALVAPKPIAPAAKTTAPKGADQ